MMFDISYRRICRYTYLIIGLCVSCFLHAQSGTMIVGLASGGSDIGSSTGLTQVFSRQSSQNLIGDPEYKETIARLRSNQIIITSLNNFRPYDPITRQESAKIFSQFYRKILGGTGIIGIVNNCVFTDISQTDYTLTDYVKSSCKLGIFKGSYDEFLPEKHLTRLQMMVILTRMFQNKILDETKDPWYLDYILQNQSYHIITDTTFSSLNQPVTRQELVLTLYRYYVKHRLISNLNKPHSRTKMITMIPNTIMTDSEGYKTSQAMINISQFDQVVGYQASIDIFDDTYLLRQTKKIIYPELRYGYSRYADLVDIESDDVVGMASFVIFDNRVEFATIRPVNFSGYYTIMPYQAGSYILSQIGE